MKKTNYNRIQYFIFFLIIILFVFYIRYYYVTIENYSDFVMTPKNPEKITPSTGFYIKSNDIDVDVPIYIKVYQINFTNDIINYQLAYTQENFTESSVPSSSLSNFNTGNIGLSFDIYSYDSSTNTKIKSGTSAFNIDFTLPKGYVILDTNDLSDSSFISTKDNNGNITGYTNNDITVTMPSSNSTTYNFTTNNNVNKISIHVGIPCRDY